MIYFFCTGDYIGNFRPYVGMSQNMMLYEREFWGEIKSLKKEKNFILISKDNRSVLKMQKELFFYQIMLKSILLKLLDIKKQDS